MGGSADSRVAVIERLFREHSRALIRFLRGRVRMLAGNEALEVAQEAYVAPPESGPTGGSQLLANVSCSRPPPTSPSIAAARHLEFITRVPVKVVLFSEFAENRTPERQVAAEQTLQRLEKLIESMPAKCGASFVMSQIQGLDAVTIASHLGITDSMVRKYVVRALLHCRQLMDLERND